MSGEPPTDGTYYEVGRFYVVPCVRAGWPHIDDKPRWWPILGPQHEDAEFINFPYQHFHVDYRFLDANARSLVSVALGTSLAFSSVITADNIVPEVRQLNQSNRPGQKEVRGISATCPPVDRIAEDASWVRDQTPQVQGSVARLSGRQNRALAGRPGDGLLGAAVETRVGLSSQRNGPEHDQAGRHGRNLPAPRAAVECQDRRAGPSSLTAADRRLEVSSA